MLQHHQRNAAAPPKLGTEGALVSSASPLSSSAGTEGLVTALLILAVGLDPNASYLSVETGAEVLVNLVLALAKDGASAAAPSSDSRCGDVSVFTTLGTIFGHIYTCIVTSSLVWDQFSDKKIDKHPAILYTNTM